MFVCVRVSACVCGMSEKCGVGSVSGLVAAGEPLCYF